MRVLITGARAPAAVEWAGLMFHQGHQVYMTDSLTRPLGSYLTLTKGYVQTVSPRFQPEQYQQQILALIEEYKIEQVIPTCEEIFYLATLQYQTKKAQWWMPNADLLLGLHNKLTVFKHLEGLPAVNLPNTRLVATIEQVEQNDNTILKPVYSRFGRQVIREITPQVLSEINLSSKIPWVQQQKIIGQALCHFAIFEQGQLIAHQTYLPKHVVNGSAATAFEIVEDTDINEFVSAFGARFHYHGQVSFDFIRDEQGLWVIECNPRATSGIHLVRRQFIDSFLTTNPLVHLGSTMLLSSGLSSLFSSSVWRDFLSGQAVLSHYKKYLPIRAQLLCFWNLVKISKQKGISLSDASTYDLEWNNESNSLLKNVFERLETRQKSTKKRSL